MVVGEVVRCRSVKEAVILVDRADAVLLDLVLGGDWATIADEDGSTELLLGQDQGGLHPPDLQG